MATPTTLPMTMPAMAPALSVDEDVPAGAGPPLLLPVEVAVEAWEDADKDVRVEELEDRERLLVAPALVTLGLVTAALVTLELATALVTLEDRSGRPLDDDTPVLLDGVTRSSWLHDIAVLMYTT
jgi:hypothetical protein